MTARDPRSDPDAAPGGRTGPDDLSPTRGRADGETGDGRTQPRDTDPEGRAGDPGTAPHASHDPSDPDGRETGADKEGTGDTTDTDADMASSDANRSGDDAAPTADGTAPPDDATGRSRRGGGDSDDDASPDRRSDGQGTDATDPLDVTEKDLDTSDVDEEDLERLVELLDEARDDPETVQGRDFEDMLTVFDDAGIDTTNLEVDDLEERFDESLKVARMLVTAAANTGEYAGLAGLRAGGRMAEAAFTSESPRDLLEETTDIARDELGRLGLPFGSLGRRSANGSADEQDGRLPDADDTDGPITVADLRNRGERLLELSADVDHEEPFHPAYVRIIEQLSADESRVLRLLATEGPQPALDVYDKGLIPVGEGSLVADGLTMLDTDAGLRYEDRADVYIDNLERLGLLSVERSALDDLGQYRVLRAQPNVERAEEAARRPSVRRGSVRLTPMGVDFCRTVFPFQVADRYDGAGQSGE